MTTIGPGTPLICVKPLRSSDSRINLTEGAIYHCYEVTSQEQLIAAGFRKVRTCANCDGDCQPISLREKSEFIHMTVPLRPFFCPERFRPLNDGDTSLVNIEEDLEVMSDEELLEIISENA